MSQSCWKTMQCDVLCICSLNFYLFQKYDFSYVFLIFSHQPFLIMAVFFAVALNFLSYFIHDLFEAASSSLFTE